MSTITICCSQMENALADPTMPLDYTPKLREFGVRILDGGSSQRIVAYCPWCGQKLPASLRDEWFDGLERLGVDPYGDEIPAEFTDERWYTEFVRPSLVETSDQSC